MILRSHPEPLPGGGNAVERTPQSEGELAIALLAAARKGRGILYFARSESRAERIAGIAAAFAPEIPTLLFPGWDCLPYDRTSPSAAAMGRRMAVLHALARGTAAGFVLVTPVEAALQRLPPRMLAAEPLPSFAVNARLDVAKIDAMLQRLGYCAAERVEEAGDYAARGEVIDLFPSADTHPLRIEHADGRITALRRFDPGSQRSLSELAEATIGPASELVADAADAQSPGREHRLADFYPHLETLFDYAPQAEILLDEEADARAQGWMAQIGEAHAAATMLPGSHAPAPERLYLTAAEWDDRLARGKSRKLPHIASGARDRVAAQPLSTAAARAHIRELLANGRRVLLTAASPRSLARIERLSPTPVTRIGAWSEIGPSGIFSLTVALDRGFEQGGIAVLSLSELFGSDMPEAAPQRDAFGTVEWQIGDAIIHVEHGLGILAGLETVASEDLEQDCLRLTYAGGASLLVPVDELEAVWRYGSGSAKLVLDRLQGESWPKRRARIESEIAGSARELVRLARERERLSAPVLVAPPDKLARFTARFPYSETPDQLSAVAAILADLASGRPMDRLICGDVGFGKTEVALRAAAVALFGGRQVALVAPTTVLVRQHVQSFTRRFAPFGIEVAQLSRLVRPAEARAVKTGLADGSVRLVIGTHALVAPDLRFAEIGLVIIDEEQRFGVRHKAALRALGTATHLLTLTATPIPRSLFATMAGLREISVIATPPVRRQPVRTMLHTFDPALVRETLLAEHRRGGQSFCVVPRIADIEPMARRLADLVPDLSVVRAHGRMPAAEIDRIMVDFAEGRGDLLLTTDIIESGLDVPNANTMLIWHPERFGLAELHQLRGRVGRGRLRASCYLLLDPDAESPPRTRARLERLARLDRLGAGFEISREDLDFRGAGDLLGEAQAGHAQLIGLELYQDLLRRAVAVARGDSPPDDWKPALHLGAGLRLPESYIPEAELRIELYVRIARAPDRPAIEALAAEIEDRFGEFPDSVRLLLASAWLRRAMRRLDILRLDAGPQGLAASFRRQRPTRIPAGAEWRGDRLVWQRPSTTALERLELVESFIDALTA